MSGGWFDVTTIRELAPAGLMSHPLLAVFACVTLRPLQCLWLMLIWLWWCGQWQRNVVRILWKRLEVYATIFQLLFPFLKCLSKILIHGLELLGVPAYCGAAGDSIGGRAFRIVLYAWRTAASPAVTAYLPDL